jgi:S-disulfanyl-L-cysteine oxidoreductase SoxD
MPRRLWWGVVLLAAVASAWPVCAESRKTVLDGIYTTAQAERGKAAYATSCASCHRGDLTGFSGPPLKGDLFMDRWREFNVDVLSRLISTTMPQNSPASLNAGQYLDILAFMLQANGLPAGSQDLSADILGTTLLVGKDGPKPLPSSAQVEVVGCMTLDTGNGWFLTSAGEPTRTLDAFTISPEELKAAATRPPGGFVFRLENLADISGFNIDASNGKKTEAKGILVRQPKGDRINVTAVQVAAGACDH